MAETIHEAWKVVEENMPAAAHADHAKFLRRVYYAGARAALALLNANTSLFEKPLGDEIYFEELLREVELFELDVMEGRA